MTEQDLEIRTAHTQEQISTNKRIQQIGWIGITVIAIFLVGLGSGYFKVGSSKAAALNIAALKQQINPAEGYALSVSYGDLGPRMMEGGVFSYEAFTAIYENSGNPLTPEQMEILKSGSDGEVIITEQNAHFLLNFFWAVGLANQNPILTAGPMMKYGEEEVGRFASTGGWSLATKPITELYASMSLIPLTAEQQKLVEEVAVGIYRPCCDNDTLFPDCNHGMAMLGILELMASQGASADEMFEAAKYINAYWFPDQALETAIYLQMTENQDFASADPRLVVGEKFSSGSGAARVHQELQKQGLVPQSPGQGGSCAN
jgi:hypothetical protein